MPSRKTLIKEHIRSGLQAFGRGRADLAKTLFQKVVELEPGNAKASAYLGTALLQLGETAQAVEYLERGMQAMRNEPQVLGNLAQAYFVLGRLDDARAAFEEARRLDPSEPRYPLGIVTSLATQKHFDEAARLLEALVRQHPANPLVWYNLGNVRRDQGRLEDACRCFARVLQIEPGLAEAHNSLGSALHALHRFEEGEREYRACLAADPDHLPAHLNLASLLIDAGRFADAEAVCRNLLEKAPQIAMVHTLLGAALAHQGRLAQALEHEREAARLAPDDPKLVENLAVGLAQVGRFEAAWEAFSRRFSLQPESASAHEARAAALLACGRLNEGWADYGYRPAALQFDDTYPDLHRSSALPDRLDGATVHLLPEQGLGDELFFLRFVPPIVAAGARVTYRANPKLASLLHRADLGAEIVQDAVAMREGTVMLVGDLPHALARRRLAGVRKDIGGDALDISFSPRATGECLSAAYPAPLRLHARDTLLLAARERLQGIGPPPYIALTWAGGTPPSEQRQGTGWVLYKAIEVELLAAAVRDVPGTLISLQRNPRSSDVRAFTVALGRSLHDCSGLNDDLEAMLALLALVDEYIGVSNTNMHLRAGAGKPARVLVPGPAEWRWQTSGERSPWFADFIVYRQSLDGDWADALRALTRDLQALHGRTG